MRGPAARFWGRALEAGRSPHHRARPVLSSRKTRVYSLLKPILFLLQAETAHRVTMHVLAWLARFRLGIGILRCFRHRSDASLHLAAFGLEFPSPIGLAAGLDKDAEAFEAFGAIGFGFVEVGTLTAQGQPGNPRPRLFRLPDDRSLINRMGFNNRGAASAAERLRQRRGTGFRLGANIGRTKLVSNESSLVRSIAPRCAGTASKSSSSRHCNRSSRPRIELILVLTFINALKSRAI